MGWSWGRKKKKGDVKRGGGEGFKRTGKRGGSKEKNSWKGAGGKEGSGERCEFTIFRFLK